MADPLTQIPLFPSDEDEVVVAQIEARRLRPLAQQWTPETLSRSFLLSEEDLLQVRTCRGSHNRLGFALQLTLIRFLFITLPNFVRVPETIIHFISLQLDINPSVLSSYPTRPQTRDDHAAQIRTYLELRAYTAADSEALRVYLIQRAMHRDDVGVLIAEAEDWLRRTKIIFPAVSTLQRLVGSARMVATEQIEQIIMSQLQPAQKIAMEALLSRSQGRRGSTFAWLKTEAPASSVEAIGDQLSKRATILELTVVELDLSVLHRNRVRQFAELGRSYHAGFLKRFDPAKRYVIMVCLLQDLIQEVTDDTIEMIDVLIGRIFTQSQKDRDELFKKQGKHINAKLLLFRSIAAIVLDRDVPDEQVRKQTFAAIPEELLQQAYDESATLVQPEDFNIFAFIVKRYGYLRSFLVDVLAAIPFTGTDAAGPTLKAVAFIKDLDANKPKWKKLPPETPLEFLDDRWRSVVCPSAKVIDHQLWMLGLAEQLRRQLRSSDILVPGSREHRNWESYLHPQAAWVARRPTWFDAWHASPEVNPYLDQVAERFDATLKQVEETWKDNSFAKIEDNRLVLSRDEKIEIPASAKAVRKAIVELLPRMKLPAVLIEVNSWLDFRQHFSHPNADVRQSARGRDEQLDMSIFAVILALGCNLPLNTMAEASGLSYHKLVNTADWYMRESTIRQAIIGLVDYHHSLPLAATFGPGSSAMSDGIRFGVTARSLYARPNPLLPTRKRGVTVYDMTSDQGSQPYLDVIRCDIRESAAVLDAALHHETELPLKEHFTDTHGYTELMFGLFELESRIFSPRIRDLPSQILYPLTREHRQGMLGALFRGPVINRTRIRDNWEEMHRIAASLQDGTVTAQLLVSKLETLKQQRGAHTGIQELGRIFKTMAALNYISDEQYRRRIHHTLNKGELLHALAREVFFGQQGLFRERDYLSQLNRATCMSLIINAIVVWNTRYMMDALEHLRLQGYPVNDSDLQHVTPLLWEHITFHGSYHFDLDEPQQHNGRRPLRLRTEPPIPDRVEEFEDN